MEVQQDFEALLALFNALRVKCLMVGGYAPMRPEKKASMAGSLFFISRALLLKNKRSIGRKKDQADREALRLKK